MIKVILLIFAASIFGTSGHILFKMSVNRLDMPDLKSLRSYLNFSKNILTTPAVWSGFGFIGISVIIWLAALAQTQLSIAHPLNSMQYIITLLFAKIFLGEKIDKMKLFGTLLVASGIILVALS